MKKLINVGIERTRDGYTAYAIDHPVLTYGCNLRELKQNLLDGLHLYFEENRKHWNTQVLRPTLELQLLVSELKLGYFENGNQALKLLRPKVSVKPRKNRKFKGLGFIHVHPLRD